MFEGLKPSNPQTLKPSMINALLTYLLEISTAWVSANLLDSGGDGVRIYHQRIPQNHEYPAVVFNVLGQSPEYCQAEMALHRYDVSFSIYHPDDAEALIIAGNLIAILEGWRGDHGGKNWKYTALERVVDLYSDSQTLAGKVVDFQFTRDN